MKIRSHYLGLVLVVCFTGRIAAAQTIDEKLEAMMKEQPTVGLSVAAVKDGKLIYTHSFGYKNLETKTPLSDNDIFRIASISKSFTSVGLMQMIQKKKISLDDDVSALAGFRIRNPRFPDKVITLRMVLSHTSSINDRQGYFDLVAINPDKNPDWAKCYNDYEPGSAYEYCNYNYNIAGAILERVSGERFDHYIAGHILKPLGISGGFNVNDLDPSRFALIYDYNRETARFILSPAAYAPRKKEISEYEMGFTTPVFSPAGGAENISRRSGPIHDDAHEKREAKREADYRKKERQTDTDTAFRERALRARTVAESRSHPRRQYVRAYGRGLRADQPDVLRAGEEIRICGHFQRKRPVLLFRQKGH